jgi:predicted lipase
MAIYDEPSAADRPEDVADPVREDDLERVLQEVPRGALAVSGTAVGIMLICWLAIYFGVFIPRGPVG